MRIARAHTIGLILVGVLVLIYLVARYFHVAPWGAR
jgi:F0F1-type ATP synthase assembly protein I